VSLSKISQKLSRDVDRLSFSGSVSLVYNPLSYARAPHEAYLTRYGQGPKEAVFLGMNPGPFGMAQTGVPFGDVTLVRDFLGIEAQVKKPKREHPKRPVDGFACPRSEVSGTRLWGWARDRFGTAERFFARFFVINYCPLCFMEEGGKNLTPDKLPKGERLPLEAVCDAAIRAAVELLEPKLVIGIGGFARAQAERALVGLPVEFGTVLHPSPASPKANRGWAKAAEADLAKLGVRL
jgi:single-strand selective monofunctional uracil DNA glycosylase